MKIRQYFVSNSSSASFAIPAWLLTDEQKELILSRDDSKKERDAFKKALGGTLSSSDNNYPRNEEYHAQYMYMEEKGEYWDWWSITENKEQGIICGSTDMNNGTLFVLLEKIGVNRSIIEIMNSHSMDMATHPEAFKFFSRLYAKIREEWEKQTDEEKQNDIDCGFDPVENPYEIPDEDFIKEENWPPRFENKKGYTCYKKIPKKD